jgi:hypothetical protein
MAMNSLSDLKKAINVHEIQPIEFMGYDITYPGCKITLAQGDWIIKTEIETITCDTKEIVEMVLMIITEAVD